MAVAEGKGVGVWNAAVQFAGACGETTGRHRDAWRQRIESYEDALDNVVVERPTNVSPRLFPDRVRREYMLQYLLDVETQRIPTLAPEGAFDAPFDFRLLIQHGHESPEPTTINLVETFHYLR